MAGIAQEKVEAQVRGLLHLDLKRVAIRAIRHRRSHRRVRAHRDDRRGQACAQLVVEPRVVHRDGGARRRLSCVQLKVCVTECAVDDFG